MMLNDRPMVGALALLLLGGVTLVALLLTSAPAPAFLAPVLLLALALALVIVTRRSRRATITHVSLRLDLDRLRQGRLRDYVVQAVGYHRQFQALAESFPEPGARATLAEGLPTIAASVRAIYDLCIVLQAYELGESQPPALAGLKPARVKAVTKRADTTLLKALGTLRHLYGNFRHSWSDPALDVAAVTAPLADIASLTDDLRELEATFSSSAQPTAARSPVFP